MSATKEYYHDLIEAKSRLFNIIELGEMEKQRLIEIAANMNIIVEEAQGKQTLIYAILNRQALGDTVPEPRFIKQPARNNHERWFICQCCGYEYDLRRHSGVCPNCETAKEKKQ